MRPVRRDDVIVLSERQDAPGSGTLLPDVEVAESSDLANRVRFFGLLLESPIEEHLPEELDELLLGEPAERGTPFTTLISAVSVSAIECSFIRTDDRPRV